MFGSIFLAFIIIVILFLSLNFLIFKRVKELEVIMEDMSSGEGDLTKRINSESNDELGMLCNHFDRFFASINDIISELKVNVQGVASGNSELASTTEQFNATFREQAAQLSGVAAAMEEMSASAGEISASLSDGISFSEATAETVNTGRNSLSSAISMIEDIRNQTVEFSTNIDRLSDSSLKIGNIIDVINDIADQTNLLALNAAIEAARAGEAGRGFAVVADEVRKLAERTQSATKEVGELISTLQKETENASQHMSTAGKSVDSGVGAVREVDSAFDNIVDSVTDMRSAMAIIRTAVDEQSRAIEGTNDNVQVISAGVEESSTGMEEVSHTVSDLQRIASELDTLVSKFKTDK